MVHKAVGKGGEWPAAMEGCHGWIQLFRKDGSGHQGCRAALDVREQLGHTELSVPWDR